MGDRLWHYEPRNDLLVLGHDRQTDTCAVVKMRNLHPSDKSNLWRLITSPEVQKYPYAVVYLAREPYSVDSSWFEYIRGLMFFVHLTGIQRTLCPKQVAIWKGVSPEKRRFQKLLNK